LAIFTRLIKNFSPTQSRGDVCLAKSLVYSNT
jgi:hypothetical protein